MGQYSLQLAIYFINKWNWLVTKGFTPCQIYSKCYWK